MVCFCDSSGSQMVTFPLGVFLKTMWISLAKDTWKVAAKPWAVYDFCRMMVEKQSVISGIVRDPNGRPVADARIYFIGGPVPLPDIAALTDAAGAFSLTAPTAGTYQIGCTAEGFAPAEITVAISRGRDVQVEIWLEP